MEVDGFQEGLLIASQSHLIEVFPLDQIPHTLREIQIRD